MEILIPITLFVMIAAIVIVPNVLRSRERMHLHDVLRASIEHGQAIPTEVIDAITADKRPAPSPQRDLRGGLIWIFVGLGIATFGYAVGLGEPDAFWPLLGIATIPFFIGMALVLVSFVGKGRK